MVTRPAATAEHGRSLRAKRLAEAVPKNGCCPSIAAIEDAGAEVRSDLNGKFVSSGATAKVSSCGQVTAGVDALVASELSDIVTWWQASERRIAAVSAGQWLCFAHSVPHRGEMNIARIVSLAIAAGRRI
jgi:hypothetical protein